MDYEAKIKVLQRSAEIPGWRPYRAEAEMQARGIMRPHQAREQE